MNKLKDNEHILPSGQFATVRSLKGHDFVAAQIISRATGQDLVFLLTCTAVQIDGKQLEYQQLMDMDLRDVMKIQAIVSPYLTGAIQVPV